MEYPLSPSVCRGVWPCGLGGAVISLSCAGWGTGQENLCWGWWADNGIPACQIFKLLYIYIHIYIYAMVLLWSIKDPLEIHSGGLPLGAAKLVDMLSAFPPASAVSYPFWVLRLKGPVFHPWLTQCQRHVLKRILQLAEPGLEGGESR